MTNIWDGFNEAPANSPGKGRTTGISSSPRVTRFNEAPANSPGKVHER